MIVPGSIRLSIVITSYTMERFTDLCGLLDSIKAQELKNTSQTDDLSQSSLETILVV